ncbi:[bacterium]|nr:[FeFe] hydrogenase H-cluster radical SAM maturase HydG [bacterium]
MYNPKSGIAEEFISHEEVLASLEYASANKNNVELIDKILEKARLGKGLTHREAAVLLDCEIEEKNQEIFELAKKIKQDYYGN